jgi:hypothetical protein
MPQPVATPEPWDLNPAYTSISTFWVPVSIYYYEYGEWDNSPYGDVVGPMEFGISIGPDAGYFNFNFMGRDVSIPIIHIAEEQRSVWVFRDYEMIQTTEYFSSSNQFIRKEQVSIKKITINEAIFFQQKTYINGNYIGITTGSPVFGDAPPPPDWP